MGSFNSIIGNINSAIYENTTRDITATALNSILQQVVEVLGINGNFMGVATPATVPAAAANIDGKQWYLATQSGVYNAAFGGITLQSGEIYLFYCDNLGWHSYNLTTNLITRISTLESTASQVTSSVMGNVSVNLMENNTSAYTDEATARLAVNNSARMRFMILNYIYLNSGVPTLRIEMYTENQEGDVTDPSIWSDNSNWTQIADIAPVQGFI